MGGPRLPQCVGGVARFGERKAMAWGTGGGRERSDRHGRSVGDQERERWGMKGEGSSWLDSAQLRPQPERPAARAGRAGDPAEAAAGARGGTRYHTRALAGSMERCKA
eukprot:363450-Chlamydomonas_euryale.AAC.6